MQKLGEVLSGWRPSGGPIGDPLVTIRSAWAEIVGTDVARSAQPVAIQGSALVVLTASGAWSQQLSFIERNILARINELGVRSIERLRFRIGTIRTPHAARHVVRRSPNRRTSSVIAGKPSTVADALLRFRRVVELQRETHRAVGGTFCVSCNAPIAAGTTCVPCASETLRRLTETCARMLFEAPWLDAESVIAAIPGLNAETYDGIRRGALRGWLDELRLARRRADAGAPIDRARIRRLASSYVLLETRIDPHRLELDSPVRRNALGDLYPFIRAIESDLEC